VHVLISLLVFILVPHLAAFYNSSTMTRYERKQHQENVRAKNQIGKRSVVLTVH
jgi:membrane protein implicated in regulation of membrane protease activity